MKSKKRVKRKHKCLCCKEEFVPNPRVKKQKYCSKPGCKAASKKTSQKKWKSKKKNKQKCADYEKKRRTKKSAYMAVYRANNPDYVKKDNERRKLRHYKASHWRKRRKSAVMGDMILPSKKRVSMEHIRAVMGDMISTGLDEKLRIYGLLKTP